MATSATISSTTQCRAHLERTGESVPATHVIGEDGFCSNCFDGRALFRREMMDLAASQTCRLSSKGAQRRDRPLLSDRENEIVQLVAQGFRNREIGEKLLISEQTVKNHLRHVFDKLGVSDRLELALAPPSTAGEARKTV